MRIENHSRLSDLSLEVRRHLIVVGPNEAGKTSLLRCLDLVLGASTAALYARVAKEDFADPSIPFVIEVDLGDFSPDERAVFPDEIRIGAGRSQTLTIRLEASLDAGETINIKRFSPGSGTKRQLSRVQVEALGWKMVGAAHSDARGFRGVRNGVQRDILESIELGEEEQLFRDAFGGIEAILKSSTVLEGLRARLAAQLSRAVPAKIQTDDLEFVHASTAEDDLLADVRLRILRGGTSRSITEQSDGARALFAIAMYDLVSEAANIVAVDEPEIHLHPTSQRSLASLLRESESQKIIATHSPDIVGAFPPRDIVVIRAGGSVVQPSPTFLDGKAKLAAHWWVRGKLEPLTSKQVILVEGVTDRIVLQRAAELLDIDLDRLGISIVETDGGNEVPNARKIFGPEGFDIPLLILIDDDAKTKTAKKLGISEAELRDHGVEIADPDLEEEYVAAIGAAELWHRLEASREFSRNQLRKCEATGLEGDRTVADVAKFCRDRNHKVQASLVVADTLTADEAAGLPSISALFDRMNLAQQ